MKFSLLNSTAVPDGESEEAAMCNAVEQATCADSLGYDGFWLTEHHFSQYGMAGIEALLGHMAAKTKRIRLGAAVWVTPLHHPVRLAEDVAALDILSGGRINFGVGRGYAPKDFGGFGMNVAESKDLHEEAIDIVLAAWSHDEFSYQGRYWNIPPVPVHPKPLQKPHPPLYQPLLSPGSIDQAIAKDINAIFGPRFQPLEVIPPIIESWRAKLASAGKHLESLVTLLVYVTDSKEQARRDLAEPLMWLKEKFAQILPDENPVRQKLLDMPFEQTLPTCITGDVETVSEKLQWLQRAGVEHALCSMHFGGLPQEKILRSMELMAKHVVPGFR